MSADDFVFATLIANHPDPATASRALAMAEAAVLRRAADALNALPQDYECDPGWGDAAERLRRTADGVEQGWNRPAVGEKSSPAGADATPASADTARRAHLLHTITTQGGRWKTSTVARWYEANGYTGLRFRAARHDLAVLRDAGALVQHDEKGVRFYTVDRQGARRV
ncbi:hypothetical protein [Streptomyces sp. NPDC003299]